MLTLFLFSCILSLLDKQLEIKMKYDSVISKLENIIENWYDKNVLHSLIAEPHDGLCDNIKDFYREGIPNEVFASWSYFDGDYWYPVDGRDEYACGEESPYSLFDNPKRLHLAVHMLQWFRFNNLEECEQ